MRVRNRYAFCLLKAQSRQMDELVSQIYLNKPTLRLIKRYHANPDNNMSEIANYVLGQRRIAPLTKDWFAIRGKLLTASTMSSVLGQNKYSRYDDAFKQRTQQCVAFTGNEATRWGQKYEQEAGSVYSYLTGLELVEEDIGLLVHEYEKAGDQRKRFGATPDFLTKSGIVVEIKCPFRRKIKHFVPDHYLAQVQMQLEVCRANVAHFVQYLPPTPTSDGTLDIYEILRDPRWWLRSLPKLDAFWDQVIEWYKSRGLEVGEKHSFFQPTTPTTRGKLQLKCEEFAILKC